MKLKLNQDITRGDTIFMKDTIFEVEDIIQGEYKIKIPMKQKGKFRYALVKDSEGVLVD